VDARQIPIEHDDVIGVNPDPLGRGVAVIGNVDRESLAPQPLRDRVGEYVLVLDHQNPHGFMMAAPAINTT
jgi:hypothetical protein